MKRILIAHFLSRISPLQKWQRREYYVFFILGSEEIQSVPPFILLHASELQEAPDGKYSLNTQFK
jgi:hypothetical protein